MKELLQIQAQVAERTEAIASAHDGWPCRKGCDECCRRLASVPRVSRSEWHLIVGALAALPADVQELVGKRIEESESECRPIVCPLLDVGSGTCLVYDARPVACRAYGFYAERERVLGCCRIAAVSEELTEVVWGNHAALEERLTALGPAVELFRWVSDSKPRNEVAP